MFSNITVTLRDINIEFEPFPCITASLKTWCSFCCCCFNSLCLQLVVSPSRNQGRLLSQPTSRTDVASPAPLVAQGSLVSSQLRARFTDAPAEFGWVKLTWSPACTTLVGSSFQGFTHAIPQDQWVFLESKTATPPPPPPRDNSGSHSWSRGKWVSTAHLCFFTELFSRI